MHVSERQDQAAMDMSQLSSLKRGCHGCLRLQLMPSPFLPMRKYVSGTTTISLFQNAQSSLWRCDMNISMHFQPVYVWACNHVKTLMGDRGVFGMHLPPFVIHRCHHFPHLLHLHLTPHVCVCLFCIDILNCA